MNFLFANTCNRGACLRTCKKEQPRFESAKVLRRVIYYTLRFVRACNERSQYGLVTRNAFAVIPDDISHATPSYDETKKICITKHRILCSIRFLMKRRTVTFAMSCEMWLELTIRRRYEKEFWHSKIKYDFTTIWSG